MDNFKIPKIMGLSIAVCGFPPFYYPGDLETLRQASSSSNARYEMSAHRNPTHREYFCA